MGTPIALFRPVSILMTSGDNDLCSKSKEKYETGAG